MLLGSSRPYPWLILEENGSWNDDDGIQIKHDMCIGTEWSQAEIITRDSKGKAIEFNPFATRV